MSRPSIVTALIAAFSFVVPAGAQVRQYTPPGGAANEAAGRKEALEQAVEEARWHAGPVRLDPAFWISDLSYVDNGEEGADADVTARAGLGLRAYLPVGSKTTVAAFALPEYVWWKERADERRLNQRFGVGSFTYFNRLSVEVTAERLEDFDYATAEVLQRVTARNERLSVMLELPLLRKMALFAAGSDASFESLAEGDALDDFYSDLNRQDLAYRGGVRYYPTEKFHLGAGVGHSETDFAEEAADRSNSGDFWYAEVGYERPKLGIGLSYQQNELAGEPGSSFGVFDGATGSVRIAWRPRERFGARVYASRALAYSLLVASDTAYVDERFGAGLNLGIGHRLGLDFFAETGSLAYEAELGGSDRVDDVDSYGAGLTVELGHRFNLRVGYRRTEISSGAGLPARELDEIQGSLGFGFSGNSGTWY